METIKIMLFVAAFVFHEAGHFFVLKKYVKKPEIKISWKFMGIVVGDKQHLHLTNIQRFYVLIAGIIVGLPFVMFFWDLFILYLVISSIDILNILVNWKGWVLKPHQKFFDFYIDVLEREKSKVIKEYKEAVI